MAVYLIRHGIDDEGFRGGWSQRGLIAEGYRQSEKLGRYLKENASRFNIHRIVSSDLQRATDTAQEIARELELPIEADSYWREMNNGFIAGLPHEIADERYPGLSLSRLRMDERYPGGESPLEFLARIRERWTALCEQQASSRPGENAAVVTHRGVINVIYHLVRGIEWTNNSGSFAASYTGIHRVEHGNGGWVISQENLTEHLLGFSSRQD